MASDETVVGPRTPMPPDGDALPPSFGPYRIRGRLGEGGMSVVYEVVHEGRGRAEALKVLHQRLESDPQIAERFGREVRAMAGLVAHDHVTPVFDSGEIEGRLYYTMPVVPGPTLHELLGEIRALGERPPGVQANEVLDRRGVPDAPVVGDTPEVRYARRVAASLVGVADALAAMHAQDVLHRDIKPSNLMLDHGHRVVVADFGLVRTKDQRITGDEEWLGTPAYMSPEQILPRDEGLDGRADLYALGATLFELLTLEVPHQGDTVAETLTRVIQRRAPSVKETNPALPSDLETLVARCLEPEPRDRYADADALRHDLAAFAKGSDIRMKPVGWTRRGARLVRRHWRLPAAVGAVLVALLLVYLTRPATLTIRTTPEGVVTLDGETLDVASLEGYDVPPGLHRIEVAPTPPDDALFRSLRLEVELDRLEHRAVEQYLPAKDPANPKVLAFIAKTQLVARTEMDDDWVKLKGAEIASPRLMPLWPRGRTREAPTRLELEPEAALTGRTVRLVAATGDDAPLAAWDVPPTQGPDVPVVLELGEALRTRLESGRAFRVEVRGPDGEIEEEATFAVMAPDEAARLDERLVLLAKTFAADPHSADFLRAEILREAGVYGEAFEAADRLLKALGNRPEVARIGLAVLQAAGLDDSGPWLDWQDHAQDAKDAEGAED